MEDRFYPDEMFDDAERREAANKTIVAKISDEDLKKVLEALEQKKNQQVPPRN